MAGEVLILEITQANRALLVIFILFQIILIQLLFALALYDFELQPQKFRASLDQCA